MTYFKWSDWDTHKIDDTFTKGFHADKKAALIEALNNRFIDDAQIWVRVVDAGGMNITVQYDTGGSDGVHDFNVHYFRYFDCLELSSTCAFKYIRNEIMRRIMPFTVGK